ncbi:MAG: Type 1 glutamine amidotransferase-like domain-containing protein [Chloroflexota bacterium]|nr:Type 1 glutamine amidotransferase-like domain-containing protein [Chloroflexota bacterium]
MKKNKITTKPRIITLFGSGETSPHMAKLYRNLINNPDSKSNNNFLLDTPFGFQENHNILSNKIIKYFQEKVNLKIETINFPDENSYDENIKKNIINSDFIFSGPGSPTYALKIWNKYKINSLLESKIKNGGILAFSSAAALTFGSYVIPVYEIYKVGETPRLIPGLDLLSFLEKKTIVVPHFNNKEGRDHDTSHCFIGKKRFDNLIKNKDVLMIGIEEHTSITFDLNDSSIRVDGKGKVLLKSLKGVIEINSGETMGINKINSEYVPLEEAREILETETDEKKDEKVNVDIDLLINIRNKARLKKDWDLSDQVRDILISNNIEIEDNSDGSKWKRI